MNGNSDKIGINRRKFLAASGVSLIGMSMPKVFAGSAETSEPSVAPAAAAKFKKDGWQEMLKKAATYKKLDAHNHVRTNAAPLVESCKRTGIMRAACSATGGRTPEAIKENNDQVIKAMKQYPDTIMGQCYINPIFKKEALDEIDRCVDNGMVMLGELYDAVKINDPLYYPIVERCIKHKIPMMLHGVTTLGNWRPGYLPTNPPNSSLPEHFVDIANRYPEAMIICGHIGGGGNWEYMCRVLTQAPSLYVDTSGSVSDEGMIDMAVQYLGADRLLFATDVNYETGVGKIMWANLTEEQRKKIFFENFNNLLRKAGNHVS
jgi:uncharacterized protein